MKPRLVDNPPNPWNDYDVEWLGPPPSAQLHIYEEEAKSILNRNESPDLPFQWSLNPYRGCFHGCLYCYARPTHEYLGWGAGSDFERRLVAKINAPELLRLKLQRRSWKKEEIAFSGVTDCYQPIEAHYRLTRRCLQVCLEHHTPVGLITKSNLIRRDVDVLVELSEKVGAGVCFSIPFASRTVAQALEPFAPTPSSRLKTLSMLAEAGIPCGISLAPMIPGLNDSDVVELLTRARDHGARAAFMTLLRLPSGLPSFFFSRLEACLPDRVSKIDRALREAREGDHNDSRFEHRMVGQGQRWETTSALFTQTCRRLGLDSERLFVSPPSSSATENLRQTELFE